MGNMSPALKAFLKKNGRFPRKGELRGGGGSTAKSKKGKGKGKGGKKKGQKATKKHSLGFELSILYDTIKVLGADINGMSLARRMIGAVKDPAQRAALMGQLKSTDSALFNALQNETKETQFVVGERLVEALPVIGKPVKKIRLKVNTAARPYTGKKYDAL